jgi:hypothetical protein
MGNELSDRQAAIRLRLAGESIENICRTLKRSKTWFHKWWKRLPGTGAGRVIRPDPGQSARGQSHATSH